MPTQYFILRRPHFTLRRHWRPQPSTYPCEHGLGLARGRHSLSSSSILWTLEVPIQKYNANAGDLYN